MSTAGCVAWPVPGGSLKGVYNHSDSYPTYLGAQVFAEAKRRGIDALAALLSYYGDWRQVLSNSICAYCGKVTGQPPSIGLMEGGFGNMTRDAYVAMRRQQAGHDAKLQDDYRREIAYRDEIAANLERTGFPDPDAKHHRHGNGVADQFDPFTDPLGIEWVYVLRPDTNLMEVWKSVRYTPVVARHWKRWSNRRVKYEVGYVGAHVHVVDVGIYTEPDWGAVERQGRELCGQSSQRLAA